jgi:hypothetical protein
MSRGRKPNIETMGGKTTMSSGPADAWLEFLIERKEKPPGITVCGLCDNSGIVQSKCVRAFCICPNGRELKKKETRRKWGTTSIIHVQPTHQPIQEGKTKKWKRPSKK